MSLKISLLKHGTAFSLSTIFSMGLKLITGFMVARYLGPHAFGVWNFLAIVMQYSLWSNLGVRNALSRELPRQIGRGEFAYAERIRDLVWTTGIISIGIVGVGIFLISSISYWFDPLVIVGLRYVTFLVFLRQIWEFIIALYKAYGKFVILSELQTVFAALNLFLSIPLTILRGFHGFMVAQIGSTGFAILYAMVKYPISLKFYFSPLEVAKLFRVGFPIWLTGVIGEISASLDRLMIGSWLGAMELGYYGLTSMSSQAIGIAPQTISEITYPRLCEDYGRTGDSRILRKLVMIPNLFLANIMPIIIGLAYLVLPVVIYLILPEYIPGLTAVQVFLLSIFFVAFRGPGNFLNAIGKQGHNTVITFVTTVINASIIYFALAKNMGIYGVALAGLGTSFIHASILNAYVFSHFLDRNIEYLSIFLRMYLPFGYMCLALYFINKLIYPFVVANTYILVSHTLIRMGIYIFIMLPLLYMANREIDLLSTIRSILGRLFSLKGKNVT